MGKNIEKSIECTLIDQMSSIESRGMEPNLIERRTIKRRSTVQSKSPKFIVENYFLLKKIKTFEKYLYFVF